MFLNGCLFSVDGHPRSILSGPGKVEKESNIYSKNSFQFNQFSIVGWWVPATSSRTSPDLVARLYLILENQPLILNLFRIGCPTSIIADFNRRCSGKWNLTFWCKILVDADRRKIICRCQRPFPEILAYTAQLWGQGSATGTRSLLKSVMRRLQRAYGSAPNCLARR